MASSSKVADILHKSVTGGLMLVTVFGLVDVTRGFSFLVKRNIDRRAAHAAEMEQQQKQNDASSRDS
ncbi:hypothetical protein CCR75_009375 [Bremia lactucae]|uniref:Uncharacterized protein n=1 Tax=Bremia lactucae TaxID=4779 RepID=A0A976FLR8_BRELC|nr:hypothetical protein CCR75_009375 [Bremia lactucae]